MSHPLYSGTVVLGSDRLNIKLAGTYDQEGIDKLSRDMQVSNMWQFHTETGLEIVPTSRVVKFVFKML